MTKKGLLIAGALMLAGCAAGPAQREALAAEPMAMFPSLEATFVPKKTTMKAGECAGVKCRIDLVATMEGGTCVLNLNDPADNLVRVVSSSPSAPRPKVLIVWSMTVPGYLFKAGDGVRITNGATQFEAGKAISAGREWQWMDKMTEKGVVYNYKITMTAPDGRTKCVLDPGLINDW